MAHSVLIVGAGRIGKLVAYFLAASGDYQIHLTDQAGAQYNGRYLQLDMPHLISHQLDITNHDASVAYAKENNIEAIISCVPYFLNYTVAKIAHAANTHFFDLTEDLEMTQKLHTLAEGSEKAFVPQCGLAPGFVNIAAHHMMQRFHKLVAAKIRVGALPINSNNALKYALNWSPEGLINEYANPCPAIENSKLTTLHPLEGLETVQIDGLLYEAFNTSGGLGSLSQAFAGKIETLNYKSLRYPGHCDKIKFLLNDLNLRNDQTTLLSILKKSIPASDQDVVLIYISVIGYRDGQLNEENFVKKVYPATIAGMTWPAIQITTASSLCASVDLIFEHQERYSGVIHHQDFNFDELIGNRFGKYYV